MGSVIPDKTHLWGRGGNNALVTYPRIWKFPGRNPADLKIWAFRSSNAHHHLLIIHRRPYVGGPDFTPLARGRAGIPVNTQPQQLPGAAAGASVTEQDSSSSQNEYDARMDCSRRSTWFVYPMDRVDPTYPYSWIAWAVLPILIRLLLFCSVILFCRYSVLFS